MTGLVLSELRKITSTRLWWGLLVGAVLYTAVNAGVSAGFAGVDPGAGQSASPGLDTDEGIRAVYAASMFTGTYMFVLVLGITGMTGEYRYQTITSTFLVSPRRSRVVGAKMVAHMLVGAAFAVAGLVASFAVGGVVIAARGFGLGLDTDRLWPSVALAVVAVAIWTLLGIGVGTLIRNQVAAVMVAVLYAFLAEPLVTFFLARADLDWLVKWLPGNASSALMAPGDTFLNYLDWWAGGLLLVAYGLVLAGLGVLLSVRRDVA